MSKSSRLNVDAFPVVEVNRAIAPTSRVAADSRLIDVLNPVMRSSMETLTPLRRKKPWFAKVFTMGHGLLTGILSKVEC